MDGLVAQQSVLSEQLSKMVTNFRKDPKARKTTAYATKLLERVQQIRRSFTENHHQILELVDGKKILEADYFKQNVYLAFEEAELNFEVELEELRVEQVAYGAQSCKEGASPSSKAMDDTDVRLPRINLPKFNGKYDEWASFKDLFTSLIHKKANLPKVEKLHYLKCSLSGEAEQLLKHYSITEANYESAWKMLVERYDDKSVLLKTQFNHLLHISNASETASSIKVLLDKTIDCVQAIDNLKVGNIWDAILVHLTAQRLPAETRQMWEQQQAKISEISSFQQLKEFLQCRFRALEAAGVERHKPIRTSHNVFVTKEAQQIVCILCKGPHYLRQCSSFLKLDYLKRFEMAKKNGLCLNCLNKGHFVGKCPSKSRCLHCKKAHHTLLHRPNASIIGKESHQLPAPFTPNSQSPQLTAQNNQPWTPALRQQLPTFGSHNGQPSTSSSADNRFPTAGSTVAKVNSSTINAPKAVLLATALVTVESPIGFVTLRALMDQGSQASIITESAAQGLGIKRGCTNISVTGIGKTRGIQTNGTLKLRLRTKTNECLEVDVLILNKLTSFVPSQLVSTSIRDQIGNIDLADPYFDHPSKIDVILGADVYAQVILSEIKKLTLGPVLQHTKLGWIISGSVNIDQQQVLHSFKVELNENVEISERLKRLWEMEEVDGDRTRTQDEDACEHHYVTHVKRESDGRYQVRLPFKDSESRNSLGFSRSSAIASLLHLEKRFASTEGLREEYAAVLREYLDLGHMHEVPHCNEWAMENGRQVITSNFLPHHAVYKESTSTKVRVVFDASRKTSSGVSLNDTLLTGPTLQCSMTAIVMKWRLKQYAMMADIAKMYRQVNMHREDSNYQKIVWRPEPNGPIKDYALNTVTFGTSSAPFLAIRTLHQLAYDERETYPEASKSLLEEFYVDDLLSGGDSVQESVIKRDQLIKLLKSGGFQLRKWLANDNQILVGLPTEDVEMNNCVKFEMDHGYKSLGILWYPIGDYFTFRLKNHERLETYTKRSVLSTIARLYDPLGWLAPFTIRAKILLQGLWLSGQDWDEPIPNVLNGEWSAWLKQLPEIENIQIPRWVAYQKDSEVSLHGFCDASQRAYAAAIYLTVRSGSTVASHLLVAKTKVAPVKPITIPRLELCGAVLLARLLKEVKAALKFDQIPTWLWTDSEVVLAWLKGLPTRWTVFVSNRTAHILDVTGNIPWRYVPSKDNPADAASRGIKPGDLLDSQLWWHGPSWLTKGVNDWPKNKTIQLTNIEKRKSMMVNVGLKTEYFLDELLKKYSSLMKLIRVTAYCFRFLRKKSTQPNLPKYLTSDELRYASEFWIRHVQQDAFPEEICELQKGTSVGKKSRLVNLNPFIDNKGIMRVGGRLEHAPLTFDARHPMILPRNGVFTDLLLQEVHQATLHGQTQLMLNTLRRKFWVIDGRNRAKHSIHKCVRCFRAKAKEASQLMGNLPEARVTMSRPFTHTGVDFCGPFEIKDRRGRGSRTTKGYVAIFICLAVKAIHIEIVSDLSTPAFLAALRRFMGRRGFSSHIYSDCGTNFVGAAAELQRITKISNEAAEIVANEGVTWHFNPPASPHFGGLWEAGVKSIKAHLRRVAGHVSLTYEELSTVLIRIEACLNSRPLCPLNDDPMDTAALTPAHFLIGDVMIALPEAELENVNVNYLDRWQMTQKIAQDFWRRWKTEYLNRLQRRPKWLKYETNIKVGDLCILKDEKLPSYRWPLARIIQVHPGRDNLVRVVTVWTNGKSYTRPITKIALLPTQESTH